MSNYQVPNSYLASLVYDNLVSADNFLRQLNDLIDWNWLALDLDKLANNSQGGRPRYNPTLMFKMLFLSFLYDLSDRDTAEMCSHHIVFKYFLGLDIAAPAPDYSTLCSFRNQLLKILGSSWLEQMWTDIIQGAQEQGVVFGQVLTLDATHTLANVNTYKEQQRRETEGLDPLDKDAAWGAKGSESKIETGTGKKVKVTKYFYGYKAHLLADADTGLIVKATVSPGRNADINEGELLLLKKMSKAERVRYLQDKTLTADKGYADAILIGLLEKDEHINTAICLPQTYFKGPYQQRWLKYTYDPKRMLAKKQRYVIERINADLKNNHGLRRCRYYGLAKYNFQTLMAALAHNLKTMTTMLTGARLRPV